jgi:hypothetical protein
MRLGAWLHWVLAGYLWLLTWVSLGNWNAQDEPHLMASLMAGNSLEVGDVGFLLFITMPAVLFWIAYRRGSLIYGYLALVFDALWMLMQVQSWWVPYVFGTSKAWQLAYAKGRTTKVLPSFGAHVAPDGMHLMISILLIASIAVSLRGLSELRARRAV